MSAGRPVTVVKIGGSLSGTRGLAACARAIAASGAAVAVVPGGGPFADAVRAADRVAGLSAGASHCMALLAMAQFAFVLADIEPGLETAFSVADACRRLEEGATPVWAPLDLVHQRGLVPETWDLTSDSLAAWFAREAGAARLVLVKSAPHAAGRSTAATLAGAGLVDPLFASCLEHSGIDAYWIGDGDAQRLSGFLKGDDARASPIAA